MFSQNHMQNAQQPTQPQMTQQRADPPMMQGLSKPEASIWQQQKPYPPSRSSGDLGVAQGSVGQLQQTYNLNTQPMNTSGPSFRDLQGSQPQSSMLPIFPNMPMNHRNPMMQMPHLQMIAPNQQPPNGIDLSRFQQAGFVAQYGAKQSGDADMITQSNIPLSQDQIHGSPHLTSHQMVLPGGVQGQGQLQNGPNGPRRVTIRHGASRIAPQQLSNGMLASSMPRSNPMGISSSPPQQSTVGTTQLGFMAQPNSPAPQVFGINIPGNVSCPQQNPASLNPQLARQMGRQNVPMHSSPTPHRPTSGQVINDISPDVAQGNQFVPLQANAQMGLNQLKINVLPLGKARFESTYSQFCQSQRQNSTMHVPIAENRTVDLFDLHVEVMREGGAMLVTQRDRWPVIGGRMDFVQFPGSDTEPPRCGPVIAQQLQLIYRQRLQHFESAYIMTMRNRAQQLQRVGMGPSSGVALSRPNHPHASGHSPHLNGSGSPALAETYNSDMRRRQAELMKRVADGQRGLPTTQSQMPAMPGHVSVSGPPGIQRPPQSMVPPSSVPTGEQKPIGTQSSPATIYLTPSDIQLARTRIENLRRTFEIHKLPGLPTQQVPEDQQPAYRQLLEEVFELTCMLNDNLIRYYAVRRHDVPPKLIAFISMAARQRQLLYTSPPQFIISLMTLSQMRHEIQHLNYNVGQMARNVEIPASTNLMQTNLPSAPSNRTTSMPLPVTIVQPTTITQSTSIAPPINNRQVSLNPPPPPPPAQQMPLSSKKAAQRSVPSSPSIPPAPAAIPSPASPHIALTPAANGPTPPTQTAGSPHTPKSPKPKVGTRPRVAPRIRKPLSSVPGSSTRDATPMPVTGVKRSPEEDVTTLSTVPSSDGTSYAPSPKKIKTEWEGEASEALVKRQQEIENIKTDEDALVFFDRMKELLAITASTDNSVQSDIAASIDQILAGVAREPVDAAATAAAISARVVGDFGSLPAAPSSQQGLACDEFSEFVDFSSFTTLEDEESDSKAPTPDLVPSSEANPSPESGSDADPSGSSSSPDKFKIEALTDHLDPLRLGPLKGIDGGESAYYHADNWKWESPMPAHEQPWAMYTSQ